MSAKEIVLSASSLNTLSICGYKYFLTKIQGNPEPGKKSYNMLQGDIVGTAIQNICLYLNKHKTLSEEVILTEIVNSYHFYYMKAQISEDLLNPIKDLILNGISPDVMNLIDATSIAISCTEKYTYKVSPPSNGKKGVGFSADKKRLGMMVLKTVEDIFWFFEAHHEHVHQITNAVFIENEKKFQQAHNGSPTNSILGYFDQILTMPDGKHIINEFKYVATPYTYQSASSSNQVLTYGMVVPDADVQIFDLKANRCFVIQPDKVKFVRTAERYSMGFKMIESELFIPICGTDNYTTKNQLCGFKCGLCPYAGQDEFNGNTEEGSQQDDQTEA